MSAIKSDPSNEEDEEIKEPLPGSTDSDARGREISTVSRDALFDVLSNHRRRYALHSLKQGSGTVGIGDLAEEIAAWETEKSADLVTSTERKRIYTSLQQFHLPKMSKNGIVEYDSQAGTIELTPQGTKLDIYLDIVRGDSVPWSLYYGSVSVMSGVLLGAAWLDLPPFGLFPDIAWAVGCIVVFMISAAVHYYYDRRLRLGREGGPPSLEAE